MDTDAPLTIPEILTSAPIYDTCVRDVIDHLPAEQCDQFSQDVPYTTLADVVTIQPSPELDQRFATTTLNLYHYVVEIAQHYSPTSSPESRPISPEAYCFLVDFWEESQLSFYDLSKLVMQGKDLHPTNQQLEQRISSLFSLVWKDDGRNN